MADAPPKAEPLLVDFVCTLPELLAMKIPEREFIVDNWLRTRSITMVYAHRGLGKTWFVNTLALAIANGEPFVGYDVPKPRRTMILDGEMPRADQQERFRLLPGSDTENLTILSAEALAEGGRQHLALDEELTQIEIKAMLRGLKEADQAPEVIIFDNLSSLIGAGVDENSNTDMAGTMRFLVELRHNGYAPVFVHHTGKDKQTQRGASRKEDTLDTVVFLSEVKRDRPPEGCEFKMSFTKLRGKQPTPREQILTLQPDEHGMLSWRTSAPQTGRYEALLRAIHDNPGITQKSLVPLLGVTEGPISRLCSDAKRDGLLVDGPGLELTGRGVVAAGRLM